MTMSDRSVEFRLGASLLRRASLLWGLAIILGLPLLLVVIVVLVMVWTSGDSSSTGEILAEGWQAANKDGSLDWQLWLAAALAPLAAVAQMMQRKCYVRLTSLGMEGYLTRWAGMGFLGLSTGHWRISWESIRSVQLVPRKPTGKPALDIGGYRLVIETDHEQTRISPFPWILVGGQDHRLRFRELLRPKKLDAAKVIERAPLVQALREQGIEISSEQTPLEQAPAGFDLARHPGMVAQLALLAIAGIYAIADAFFIGAFMPLEPLPAGPFVVATVVGAVVALALGRGAPSRERWVVGLLLAAALTAAVHPGMMRYNAMTAAPQQVNYRAVGEGQFESTISGLPEIDLRGLDVPEYWLEYPAGAVYEFVLLRGNGGFYQVKLGPVYEATREFYSR